MRYRKLTIRFSNQVAENYYRYARYFDDGPPKSHAGVRLPLCDMDDEDQPYRHSETSDDGLNFKITVMNPNHDGSDSATTDDSDSDSEENKSDKVTLPLGLGFLKTETDYPDSIPPCYEKILEPDPLIAGSDQPLLTEIKQEPSDDILDNEQYIVLQTEDGQNLLVSSAQLA